MYKIPFSISSAEKNKMTIMTVMTHGEKKSAFLFLEPKGGRPAMQSPPPTIKCYVCSRKVWHIEVSICVQHVHHMIYAICI